MGEWLWRAAVYSAAVAYFVFVALAYLLVFASLLALLLLPIAAFWALVT